MLGLYFGQPRSFRSLRIFELPPYTNIRSYHACRLVLLFEAFNLSPRHGLHGYLAQKKTPSPQDPHWCPRHMPTAGS